MTCPPGAGPTVDPSANLKSFIVVSCASSSEVGLMCRQIAREITGRRVTLAGVAAIASLAFATWAFIPNAYSASDVENCDRTLGPAAPGVDFSGVFEGSIVEVGQSGSAAQAKFVRSGHSVRGSYLLGEICGSINGEVTRDQLEFSWRRAGNSGHGIASQIADRVSGTFGLGEDAKGGGTFVLKWIPIILKHSLHA
jgi:hypothetical protein